MKYSVMQSMLSIRLKDTAVLIMLLLPVVSSCAVVAKSEPKILTLEESIEIALKDNPALKAALERIRGAQERIKEAKTLFLPKVKAGSFYTHLNEPPTLDLEAGVLTPQYLSIEVGDDNMYGARIEVQQPLFTGGKISSINEQSRANLGVTEYNYKEAKQNMVLQVREAYYRILLVQKYKEVSRDAVKQMKAHLESVNGLYKAGTVPHIDLLRTEVQLADVEQAFIKAENGVELAKSSFNTILGRDLNLPVEVVDVFKVIEQDYDLDKLLEKAQERRPEIYKMRYCIEIAEAGIRVAKSNHWPQVGLFGNYRYHKGDEPIIEWEDDWMVGVSVSMDIWNWGETEAQAGQAKATLRELKHLETQLKNGIALEVKGALLNLGEAERRIKVSEKAESQAQESLNSTQIEYKNGRIDNVEVLSAQLALTQARTNQLEAIYKYILSQARLEKAIGKSGDI